MSVIHLTTKIQETIKTILTPLEKTEMEEVIESVNDESTIRGEWAFEAGKKARDVGRTNSPPEVYDVLVD
jgi:hypothetical protein